MTEELDPIKVGIAGLGRSGWGIHARMLESLEDKYEVVAACDLLQERLDEMEERFGCPTYTDFDEFLQDDEVELVVVALPSNLHPSHAIKALQAGKNVICEKPMAVRVADADAMMDAADEAGKLLTVFQQRRYSPDFVQVKRVIDSGVLGRVFFIRLAWQSFGRRWDWQTLQEYDGGTLNNSCPHSIDQILQFFGGEMPKVFSHLEPVLTLGDANDHAKLLFQGENGLMVDMEVTSGSAYKQDDWLVMGTQGGLTGTSRELRWKYIDPEALEPREVDTRPTPDRSYNREPYAWTEETWSVEESEDPGYIGYYLDLYETIRNGAPLSVTPESVRPQVAILEYSYKKNGC